MEDLRNNINFAFFGSTTYSYTLLRELILHDFFPKVIFSIPEQFTISYSPKKVKNTNYANLKEIALEYNIPYFEIDSIDGQRTIDFEHILEKLDLDLILVLGWYYMLPSTTRKLAKHGAWGIHASLLPNYAGGAPLNWAIINGEKETGVTLFRMDEGVDNGDIILQQSFEIGFEDTIKDVYEKATLASKNILLSALTNIDNIQYIPQNKNDIKVYPQRKPDDGIIDLSRPALDIYNFIRAQSSPYPGAFIKTIDGKKLIIEKARIEL